MSFADPLPPCAAHLNFSNKATIISGYQGRIKPPEAARGHATTVDGEM